jgi:hypothetical protein
LGGGTPEFYIMENIIEEYKRLSKLSENIALDYNS